MTQADLNLISSFYYPVGALEYIQRHKLEGNVLARFAWGELITWTFFPDGRVAMDGYYETVYPPEICEEYFDFLFGRPGWRVFLHKYPHDIILLKADSVVRLLLRREPEWKEVYADTGCVLFVRRPE